MPDLFLLSDSGGSPPNGLNSPMGGIPTYQGSSLSPTDIRARAHTVGTALSNGGTNLGVVLRRDRNSSQDGMKVGRTHSNAGARRSKNLETKSESPSPFTKKTFHLLLLGISMSDIWRTTGCLYLGKPSNC